MKTLLLTFILFLSTTQLFSQTPTKKLGKPKTTESGQVQTDTSSNRTIVGSASGSSDIGAGGEDSIKTNNSSDTIVTKQPAPKGK